MWPFSTIATLRRELSDAKAYVSRMEAEIDAAVERDQRRVNEIKLMERSHEERVLVLKHELTVTRKALLDAQKNDTPKDAKTGKFAKKAKDV